MLLVDLTRIAHGIPIALRILARLALLLLALLPGDLARLLTRPGADAEPIDYAAAPVLLACGQHFLAFD